MRRFGDAPEKGRKYVLRPGAYVMLPLGDDILLTHQARPTPEFQLPGGGIDPGESPLPALHREVIEETGWSITGLRRVGAFRRFTFMPDYDIWAEKMCTIYRARPVRRLSDPLEKDHTAVWMPIDHALALLGNDGDAHFLGQLLRS